MKNHSRLLRHTWLVAAAVVVLIAGHGIISYYVFSHAALSVAVVSGSIILVVIKHLGFCRSSLINRLLTYYGPDRFSS